MSASSHDAIPDRHGQPLKFDAPELDAPEITEDIADEITSELAVDLPRVAAPAQDVAAPRESGQAAEAEPGPPGLGSVLRERYVLEALIGAGGTATVFRAFDRRRDDGTANSARVAVKLLRPERRADPRSIARLQREFRQTQAVAHPGVVRFLDLDCDGGTWFIVMELLAGDSLAAVLRRAAPATLPRQQALAVAAAVAEALAYAHARDVVHGDVKPANIFVTESGTARLLDFGTAPAPGDPPEPVAATRAYASPEVQGGEPAGTRDDAFSLACVACELLSGEHPFGRGGARSAGRAGVLPRRPGGLEDSTWQLLLRALEPGRERRPDLDELARALRAAADPAAMPRPAIVPSAPAPAFVAVAVPAAAPAALPEPPARRSRLVAGAITAAGLALVLGILIGRLDSETASSDAARASILPVEAAQAASVPVAAAAAEPAEDKPAAEVSAPEDVAPALPGPTGQVAFDQPAMTVSNRAVVAAIPLRHVTFGGPGRDARVNWRIIEGSARSGRDFGGAESGVETFPAGNTFRMLYVPVLANPDATRDRTFVVELTDASPGIQLGRTSRVAVTILGDR